MAAQVTVCTKEQQHFVIHFLWAKGGVLLSEIHLRIVALYGENYMT